MNNPSGKVRQFTKGITEIRELITDNGAIYAPTT
jgi:hypothetical protein